MRLKKYRKVLAAGLAAVMTMGMLTGCGGGGGNNAGNGGGGQSASSGSQGSSSSEDAGSGEIVPLKWVTIGNGMPSNYDSWIAKVNEYIGDKVGVSLDMEVIPWGDWDKRRNIIVSTNEPYDIIFGNGNNYIADINHVGLVVVGAVNSDAGHLVGRRDAGEVDFGIVDGIGRQLGQGTGGHGKDKQEC